MTTVFPEFTTDVLSSGIDGITVVVPVYNEAPILCSLMDRLSRAADGLGLPYEIILVNDGSSDGSWARLLSLRDDYRALRLINLMRNYGQHNALLAGIREANYSTVVTIDADLQNPPEEIPKLLAKLREGYDVVYGTPDHEQHGLLRDFASQATKIALQSAMGAESARNVSAFRAIRTHVRDAFATYQSPHANIDVLLTWGTTRFAAVVVDHDPRRVGASKYTLGKLLTHALNMTTGFSTLPLRLASLTGFAFTFFGLGVLAYVVGHYVIWGGAVPGFPFLASAMAIFSGAQLFALGIVGEYLARMHLRIMDRPAYTIRDNLSPRPEAHYELPTVTKTIGSREVH